MSILTELSEIRGRPSQGGNPNHFVELYGSKAVEMSAWEPDPNTFRGKYYYNTTTNNLYIKISCTKEYRFKYRTVVRRYSHWKLITED